MGKILFFVLLVAVAIYLTVRVIERRGVARRKPRRKQRPFGPDDDPDFLRGLDRDPDGDDNR